jgi:hypothetical protein
MSVSELTTLIGEFVYTEVDDVHSVEYINAENREPTAFTVKMENGKQFSVELKEKE